MGRQGGARQRGVRASLGDDQAGDGSVRTDTLRGLQTSHRTVFDQSPGRTGAGAPSVGSFSSRSEQNQRLISFAPTVIRRFCDSARCISFSLSSNDSVIRFLFD